MDTALISLSSFLAGGFLTAIGFIFGWSNKITSLVEGQKDMSKDIASIATDLKEHCEKEQPTCPAHNQIILELDRIQNKLR